MRLIFPFLPFRGIVEAVISADSGLVVLSQDTVVATLRMEGGALVTHRSTCLPGWTAAPDTVPGVPRIDRCYRLFVDAASWASARDSCARAVASVEAGARGGALRGSLASIGNPDERQWVERLCWGDALGRDCWVSPSTTSGAGGKDLEEVR